MSNFKCEECGADITEKEDGSYGTFCDHYPPEFEERKIIPMPEENQLLGMVEALQTSINNVQTSISNIAERQLKIMDDFKICQQTQAHCRELHEKVQEHLDEIEDKKKNGNGDGRILKTSGLNCCSL